MTQHSELTDRTVVNKLVITSVAMLVAPLALFFILQNVFGASLVVSGGVAAAVANVVLIAFIVAAFKEETNPVVDDKKTQ